MYSAMKLVFSLLLTLAVPSMVYAKQPLTPEQIQLQKDRIKYKSYVPANYDLFEAIQGDLNKDGIKDTILIVKATDPKAWVSHEQRGKLDRNRRVIIVLLAEKGKYKKLLQNLSCFSSENEEGGVYFAPELWFEFQKGILNIEYLHGRYGVWAYRFRLENNDLRLIGFDLSSNRGPLVEYDRSVNFLTGKKRDRKNLIEDEEQEPQFKETWSKIQYPVTYLSKIKDFDKLDF